MVYYRHLLLAFGAFGGDLSYGASDKMICGRIQEDRDYKIGKFTEP